MCNNAIRHNYNAKDALDDLALAINKAKCECAKIREYHHNEYNRVRHGW